jgi:hypothetical protein
LMNGLTMSFLLMMSLLLMSSSSSSFIKMNNVTEYRP